MKKFIRRITAALAAAVMTISAANLSVWADTVADGWVKEDGTERRYMDGSPYTGWLNVDDGTKKYCLDGYLVTGSFTVDGKTYSFGKDGVLTGKGTVPEFSAECGEVNPDTKEIRLSVYANKNDGKTYAAPDPVKMERWVKGKWVDCKGKNVSYGYTVDVPEGLFSYQYSTLLSFYPQKYTNNNFCEGYYRLTFSASDAVDSKAASKKFYMVFKVTPKNAYKNGWVSEGSLERRYKNNFPYTGWLNMKDGTRKYCLDGYLVKGELQMDDVIYTFDDEGICISKSNAVLSADCGGKVSADTKKVDISIYLNVNNNDEYWAVDPVNAKRWEYGRWVDCRGYGTEYITDDCLADITYSKSDKVHFYPQEYTNNNFSAGYYKIDLTARSLWSNNAERFSAVFEVVPYEVIKNGWVREGDLERRYTAGKPYTGWLNMKDGTKKYCFDGYVVTGDFQIGKYIYSFSSDGIYTGIKRKLVLTASCGNAVASTAQNIKITVANSGADGKDYTFGMPYKMERWENGRWVSCSDDENYAVPLLSLTVFAKSSGARSNIESLYFSPQTYTGGRFTPGYYRVALSGWASDSSAAARQDIYAVFEVV